MTQIDVSVVIGFRDWGVERLGLALRSIRESFGSCRGEIILVDYGSEDPRPAEAAANSEGATLVRVSDVDVWSRSRALNAGFAEAGGDLLISTDADMLFAPTTIEIIHRWWKGSGHSALFLQCRDLPENPSVSELGSGEIDWDHLESVSSLRPRWGVGGMMAIDRKTFAAIRGFDERMQSYGREDMDFALRARRAGLRMVWIEERNVRIYHMWHPATIDTLANNSEAEASLKINRAIYANDETTSRNRLSWVHGESTETPLVGVVLPDGTDKQREFVEMLSLQTINSIELVVPSGTSLMQGHLHDLGVSARRVDEGDLSSLISNSRGTYVMVLHEVSCISVNFIETVLDEMRGMNRLVVATNVPTSESRVANEPSLPVQGEKSQILNGLLFERRILDALMRVNFLSGFSARSQFLEAFQDLGIEFHVSSEAKFISSNSDTLDVLHVDGRYSDDLHEYFWPFLLNREEERSVRISDKSVQKIETEVFDGRLRVSLVSVDGDIVSNDSQLFGASISDLARLQSRGHDVSVQEKMVSEVPEDRTDILWLLEATTKIVEELNWSPFSAIFSDKEPIGIHQAPEGQHIYSRKLGRTTGQSKENTTVFLTRNNVESESIVRALGDSVCLMALGPDLEDGFK